MRLPDGAREKKLPPDVMAGNVELPTVTAEGLSIV